MKLSLSYPVKPYIRYQDFGESNACYRVSDKNVITKQNGICPTGYVDLYEYSGMKGHNGIDMFGGHGVPCYATHDGFVDELQSEEDRGLGIGITSKVKYEIEGGEYYIKTRYWHLKSMNVEYDQEIKTGDLIGWCDNTGYSSGDHLHFELKPVLQNSKGRWYNVFQDNGYYGAISPTPYWNGKYAEDKKFIFNKDLSYLDQNQDVTELQKKLISLGYSIPLLEQNVVPFGYYGNETRIAVFLFQFDKVNKRSFKDLFKVLINWGKYCDKQTRDLLNNS